MLDNLPFSSLDICVLIAAVTGYFLYNKQRQSFPIVNDYPGDFFRKRAHQEYQQDALGRLAKGSAKYDQKPFAILVLNGCKIVLSPSLTCWVKANKCLDHQQLVRDEFFASYRGFETLLALHHPNRMVINTIQSRLAKNDQTLPVLDAHVKLAISKIWGESKEWSLLDWDLGTGGLISRSAASIFVGPELATNAEWQEVSRGYVQNFFAAVPEMHTWHPWLRPVAHWFLPHTTECRAGVQRARDDQ